MSLLCRLKKLVHKGELEEKDLERIVIIPQNATNGDMIKAMFPNVDKYKCTLLENHNKNVLFGEEWWNSPYRKKKNTEQGLFYADGDTLQSAT